MRIPVGIAAAAAVAVVAVSAAGCSSASKSTAASGAVGGSSTSKATAASGGSGASGGGSGGGSSSEIDACKLLTVAQASSLGGQSFATAASATIATGQDQCTYSSADGSETLVVIVYQPDSGVSYQMMTSVLSGVGAVKDVTGVGDKAQVGQIELDVQAGSRLIAVQGVGGLLTGDYSKAVAVAKAVIAGLS